MGDKKIKDFQPPYEEGRDGLSADEVLTGAERPGRAEIANITDASDYRDEDGALRQTLRGDETKGDPDERDVAGAPSHDDTPHGREEAKPDRAGAANQNG